MDWNTHPLPNSLCVAPDRVGEDEHTFSLAVAHALARARFLLSVSHLSSSYAHRATAELRAYAAASMALRQQMLREYLLAWSAAQEGELPTALIHLDASLNPAEKARDLHAYCELAWRAGGISRQLGFLPDAYYYLSEALAASHSLMQREPACDSQFRADLHLALASVTFELALFPAASHHLDEAALLLRSAGLQAHLQAVSLNWIQAQVFRWLGQLGPALVTAMRAADDLMPIVPPDTSARSQLVVAEIALDLAERFSRGPGAPFSIAHASYLDIASRYIQSAEDFTQQAADPIGEMVALLARRRWRRIDHRGDGDLSVFEAMARRAESLGDFSVVGRAFTALGDELRARGRREAALSYYLQASEILERQKFFAGAILPRRALLIAREMSSDITDMQTESGL